MDQEIKQRFPSDLQDPASGIEGMQVRWMMVREKYLSPGEFYAFRWETLGKRRFYEGPEKPVPPSALELYRLEEMPDR